MSVTVRQVAARAGVSPVVVSRVLHNKAEGVRVSEATAERVRNAAQELGYRVNVLARNFRAQRTQMIGVLHGVGFGRGMFRSGSRYLAALMDGLVDGAFKHGYSITLCPKLLGNSPEDAMSDGRFDGLIWYSAIPSEESARLLAQATVPMVVIHSQGIEFGGKFPTIICDNAQGIALGIDHLLELGHQRIAFANGGRSMSTESFMRQEAFVACMCERGIPVGADDILNVSPDYHEIDGFLLAPNRPTAVIAQNDDLAGPILERAAALGIKVPEELSVVGFDSTDYCDLLRPTLTSIYQPLAAMGEGAIDLLMDCINGSDEPSPHVTLPCGLDIRESTAPSLIQKVEPSI